MVDGDIVVLFLFRQKKMSVDQILLPKSVPSPQRSASVRCISSACRSQSLDVPFSDELPTEQCDRVKAPMLCLDDVVLPTLQKDQMDTPAVEAEDTRYVSIALLIVS